MNKNLKEAEKGYIAGLLDGEGCLRILKSKNSPHYYSSRIEITNSNKEVLEWIKSITGIGTIRKEVGKSRKLFWKDLYKWYLYDRKKIFQFLKIIFPYLKIKYPQAILLLNLKLSETYGPISKEERKIQENLYQKAKKLNQKGEST